MSETTSISVSKETRDKLEELRLSINKRATVEDAIIMLINEHDHANSAVVSHRSPEEPEAIAPTSSDLIPASGSSDSEKEG